MNLFRAAERIGWLPACGNDGEIEKYSFRPLEIDLPLFILFRMDGTTETELEAKRREPSPFMAEVEGRLRGIFQAGAEPWNEAAELRREARRRDMEILRLSAMESALHTTEYIAGRLPAWKCGAFEHVKDPLASLANLNRSIVQITLAEERFDENNEEHAARLKSERDAREKAEQNARAQSAYTASQQRRADNKQRVQSAVRAITLDSLELDYNDAAALLDDLFLGFDLDDGNYNRDAAGLVADLCARLGLAAGAGDDEADDDEPADPKTRRARAVAMAREYLDALTPSGDATDPAEPPAQAQGPPH
jgi:hypothetical protein